MKEAYYFSHDANAQHDPKVIKMLSMHGWAGYGLYWAIIERLRNEPDYTLPMDYDCIAYALRTENNIVKQIVEDYDLFIMEDDYFYSESLWERMKKKDERSQKARESALKRWKPNAKAKRLHSEPNAIKESKVKEKKVNKTKENKKPLEFALKLFEEFWSNYPRKIGKHALELKWIKMKEQDMRIIITSTDKWVKYWKEQATELQYIPHPATWINQRRWEDEIAVHATPEEKLIETQEMRIKRERKKQQDEWDSVAKKSASADEIASVINSWKKQKGI